MKKGKTFAAFGLALASIAALGGAKAAYADTLYLDTDSNSIDITRTLTNVYTSPTVTYTYTIDKKSAEDCPTVSSGLPKTGTISFSSSDTITDNKVTKTGTVSLADVVFNGTLGECVLKVTESVESGLESTYPADSTVKYFKTVTEYVVDGTTREPIAGSSGYTKHVSQAGLLEDSAGNAKNMDFESAAQVKSYIELEKKVSGSLANPNGDFVFNVRVNSNTSSGSYRLVYYSGGTASGSTDSCNYNQDCRITLKHNESVRIGAALGGGGQFTPGADTYNITETEVSGSEPLTGYTTAITASNCTINNSERQATNCAISPTAANNKVSFLNTKDYNGASTGRFFTILPFVLLGMISSFAVVLFAKKKAEAKK